MMCIGISFMSEQKTVFGSHSSLRYQLRHISGIKVCVSI